MASTSGSAFGQEIDTNEIADGAVIAIKCGDIALIGDVVVTGATTQSIAFTGLNLDADGHYKLVLHQVGSATSRQIYMYCNADTTGTNYNFKIINTDGTTVTTSGVNDAYLINGSSNTNDLLIVDIVKRAGQEARANGIYQQRDFGGVGVTCWEWTGTANVTTLTLTVGTAGAYYYGVGSRAKLYKVL